MTVIRRRGAGLTSTELRDLEATRPPPAPRPGRRVRKRPPKGWDTSDASLRGQVEDEFREQGAKVFREEKRS